MLANLETKLNKLKSKASKKSLEVLDNIEFQVWKDGSISVCFETSFGDALDLSITNEGQLHTSFIHFGRRKND